MVHTTWKMSNIYDFILVDLYDVFLIDKQYKYCHKCDGHWNEYGNKIVSEHYLKIR